MHSERLQLVSMLLNYRAPYMTLIQFWRYVKWFETIFDTWYHTRSSLLAFSHTRCWAFLKLLTKCQNYIQVMQSAW